MIGIVDTIAALATPPGIGGVAIVRISGANAVHLVGGICRLPGNAVLSSLPARYLSRCVVVDGDSIIDDGMVVRFEGPASFTGEDVVELHLHGNMLIVERVLEVLFGLGVRHAIAGEFTQRSF